MVFIFARVTRVALCFKVSRKNDFIASLSTILPGGLYIEFKVINSLFSAAR
jgi:hypothetical protein